MNFCRKNLNSCVKHVISVIFIFPLDSVAIGRLEFLHVSYVSVLLGTCADATPFTLFLKH